jgi:AcrR family transcriptional regulator
VVDVATRLMLEHGYAATTVADVAAAAEVSPALVYSAFGSKVGLLTRVLDAAIAGDDDPVAVGERPPAEAVARATTAKVRCRLTGELVADIQRRTIRLVPVLRDAAGLDPEIAALAERSEQGRRVGMTEFVALLDEAGQLRAGLSAERAADLAWTLTDPAGYHRLVVQRGWSHEEYAAWLGSALHDSLCRR